MSRNDLISDAIEARRIVNAHIRREKMGIATPDSLRAAKARADILIQLQPVLTEEEWDLVNATA